SAYEKTLQEQVSKADEAEKQKLALQYKYADARKQIAIDLDNDIKEIEKSTLSGDEQINAIVMANQQASDKLKAIDIENLEH
ncbi:hypothetical protein ABTI29_21010, partial [Acinetobacter baumannii]